MQLRNELTGEIVSAHILGKTEDGKRIYKYRKGWAPCDSRGEPLDEALLEFDDDGNYLEVGTPPPAPPDEDDEDFEE